MWALAVGILVWIFRRTPPEEVYDAAIRTNALPFLFSVTLFSAITLLSDSLTHYWLFNRFIPRVSFKSVFKARGETYLLLTFGFLYGQGGMAYLISKRSGKPLSETAGAILFLTLNSLITLLVFPTIALLFFVDEMAMPGFRNSREWTVVVWWLALSWPLIGLHFAFWSRLWDNPLRKKLKPGVHSAFSKARLKDYGIAQLFRGVQAVNWCFFSWIALSASGINLPFKNLLLFGPMVGLISAIPTPGRLGTSQAAWKLLFGSQVGGERGVAALVAFSLLWVLSVNLIRWVTGALFLVFSGDAQGPEEPQNSPVGDGREDLNLPSGR